ncbi:MAG: M1 family aminopeptidase, partial [Cyanobacteria bacterium J06642_12]
MIGTDEFDESCESLVQPQIVPPFHGDQVTEPLWLNEGFAAFVEFIGANHTDPSWQMMDQFIVDDVQSSMVLDSHL